MQRSEPGFRIFLIRLRLDFEMMQVNLTQFSKDLPVYLKMAGFGEEVLIILRGKAVARLMPPSDETVYLLSSSANAKRLKRAKKEIEKGRLTEIENIDDLDKLLE